MKIKEAIEIYISYLMDNSRPNTLRSFVYTLNLFNELFGGKELDRVSESDIINFISRIAGSSSLSTKRNRLGAIQAFFNFIIELNEEDFNNPCSKPIIRKRFRKKRSQAPTLLDKELIDEIIYRTTDEQDRLVLELMGRFRMRVREVLNIRKQDINFDNSTILIIEPKSGREDEKVFITKKFTRRLSEYIIKYKIDDQKLFQLSYSTIYRMVRRSGSMVNSKLRPHDLRRHAATHASRNNIPLQVVSQVILRHSDISTTQR